MPTLPCSVSDTESPTGWTKQLISVALRSVPAAELMRPPGMKPWSSASKNSGSKRAGSFSSSASARATRWRTSLTLCSPFLAYFSSNTSREMSCSAMAAMFSCCMERSSF
ncbi:Uncharacterised protein [Chromobacterium violaceum]|uniref:Uncharacterized protein n=1 Tax=Chromobacterium violaceum TaxID=536 RepID=A0A447T9Q4_CHRVL|nr:Uncharacterised protein [Chromobacterium violaceum]